MSAKTWTPGATVAQYVLLRELARGGMGEIWLAHQKGVAGFERLVVIKRIIATDDDDPGFVNMFLDEARIASQLHHPNVVQVFELAQAEGSYYLVMEYLPGQTLGRVARRIGQTSGGLDARLAVDIIAAAAKGLGYAHRCRALDGSPLNIVHRDVSPQNILITYDGSVKVLDFGIAQAAGRRTKTSTGIVRGKITYMSPEQAMARPVAAATDVFALGIVLFELLTNTRLWQGADDLVVIHAHLAQQPMPRVRDRRPDIDPALDVIVAAALAVDARERFPDGEAFHEALDAWSRKQPRGEPLERVMRTSFSAEIEKLPEFQRAVQMTPSGHSAEHSLPDNTLTVPAKPLVTPSPMRPLLIGLVFALIGGGVTFGLLSLRSSPDAVVVDAGVASSPPPVDAGSVVEPPVVPVAVPVPQVVNDAGAPVAAPVAAPVVAPVRPEPVSPRPPPAESSKGRLTLSTDPWTRVTLNGKVLGETPLVEVVVPAGKQRFVLVNEQEGVNTAVEITIVPGQTTVKKLSF